MKVTYKRSLLALSVLSAIGAPVTFAEEAASVPSEIEEVTVIGRSVSYANNATDDSMLKQQASLTSVLAAVDNLPGVLINEGDTFGSDDWSTSISIRGFQVDLSQQQIGITVDGIANGNSNYGGGAKANRYIDTENLRAVEVSQGTADIASRSNEALGGTLNFTTINPGVDEQLVVSATTGDFGAQKMFMRLETGEIAPNTYAWMSMSSQYNNDWMDGVGEANRDHYAAKIVSYLDDIDITAYMSYDDTHEDNYQRIYGLSQFEQNPEWDQLTSDWTGIPYVDQSYRRGWSTLRENWFAYLEANMTLGAVEVKANAYYHDNSGRGDWIPPYIVDVTNDGTNGHSELIHGNTALGGAVLGQIFFVDANGMSLSPEAGCVSSLTFPYGGGDAQYDPACYPDNAIPVSSYRHTNYKKQRAGINVDAVWTTTIGDMENTVRGGLWYEDYNREETRSWQKIIDSTVGYEFDHVPYWIQYSREFPVETLMFYVEDEFDFNVAKVRVGAKQFNVDVEKKDRFDSSKNLAVSSDSDVLLSAGVVAPLPVEGLEIFAGYAENYAAIKDVVLERDDADLSKVEPETAENIDVGIRYAMPGLNASLTYYSISFENRIRFVSSEDVTGIDFLESAAGGYINDGGIESDGIEMAVDYQVTDSLGLYVSYTYNNSEYTDEGSEGVQVIGTPEDMAVISLDYQRGIYSAGLSTKYVGERSAGSFTVNAYSVSDFYLGATLEKPVSGIEQIDVRLTINNLMDESYLGTIATGAAWIGAPRTTALNFKATF
ncbi:TonB-dependent receptor [Alteromonas sp. AMM-1]|uniref:TonB-dependent receptor n=1 Tax=Alteromonas sp. AMM-1 TaxID=3394233 RepID=UPI0039A77E33